MIRQPSEGLGVFNHSSLQKVLVVGVGNEYRNDDGVGLLVARAIKKRQFPNVVVQEESGEGAALIDAWKGFQNVLVADAVSSGAAPGTIFRIDVQKETVPAKFFHYSTHAFSISEAIELARVMNVLPSTLIVYGIEGYDFAAGTALSIPVQHAVDAMIERMIKEMQIL
jgi:hydrogenase maturation protease